MIFSKAMRQNITAVTHGCICICLLILFCAAYVPDASACDNVTVRDASFSEPRDMHRLCVIGNTNDTETQDIASKLKTWLETTGAGLNVEVVEVDADDRNVDWEEYGIPSAPPSLPVSVLAGTRNNMRKRFFVDYWEPGPDSENLSNILSSPARDTIRREVSSKLAVLLYIRGAGRDAGSAENVIRSVAAAWSEQDTLGVSVVKVDRADMRERILLSFTGAGQVESDWAAVIFGKGKVMQPLIGSEITEVALNECIETLLGECTCLVSASGVGVDIPMLWDENSDTADVAYTMNRIEDTAPVVLTSLAALSSVENAEPEFIQDNEMQYTAWDFLKPTILVIGSLICVVGCTSLALVWPKKRKENN